MTTADERRRAAAHVFVGTEELTTDGVVELPDDIEHHLTRVLRLRSGSTVSVSDGAGSSRLAIVVGDRQATRIEVSGPVGYEPLGAPMTLATAMPKGDRLDWLVQKATELGVGDLRLLHTDHSVVAWKPADVDKKLGRLQRIAVSAAEQSRRVWLPSITAPVPATELIDRAVIAEPGGRPIGQSDLFIAIGPEGGWSNAELALAGETVTLGQNVLRCETAAIAAITLSVAARH